MGCRYLEHEHSQAICRASDPEREPSRGEQKCFCQATDQRGCSFFRFRRATGRALLFEDFLAWQRKRADAELPVEPEPAAGDTL